MQARRGFLRLGRESRFRRLWNQEDFFALRAANSLSSVLIFYLNLRMALFALALHTGGPQNFVRMIREPTHERPRMQSSTRLLSSRRVTGNCTTRITESKDRRIHHGQGAEHCVYGVRIEKATDAPTTSVDMRGTTVGEGQKTGSNYSGRRMFRVVSKRFG